TEDCQDPCFPNSPIWEKGHPQLRVDTKGRRVAESLPGVSKVKKSQPTNGLIEIQWMGIAASALHRKPLSLEARWNSGTGEDVLPGLIQTQCGEGDGQPGPRVLLREKSRARLLLKGHPKRSAQHTFKRIFNFTPKLLK
ncbi:hypothetical protein Dimus_028570, partial [Dionaea muscipula]